MAAIGLPGLDEAVYGAVLARLQCGLGRRLMQPFQTAPVLLQQLLTKVTTLPAVNIK